MRRRGGVGAGKEGAKTGGERETETQRGGRGRDVALDPLKQGRAWCCKPFNTLEKCLVLV